MFYLFFFIAKESVDLSPNILSFDVVIVQHVGPAVDRNSDFRQVWVEVLTSESLVLAVYGSTQSRRMAFRDLLWGFTLRFILVSVPFEKVAT